MIIIINKRFIASLSAISVIAASCFYFNSIDKVYADETDDTLIIGDINGDGIADSSDALSVLQIIVGTSDTDSDLYYLADINRDFEITSSDALSLLQYTAGVIDTLDDTVTENAYLKEESADVIYGYDSDGNLLHGIKTIDGKKYGFDSAGLMLIGNAEINGTDYNFLDDGTLITGWQYDENGKKFYKNGFLLTGWNTIYNKTYYFNENQYAVSGITEIDGENYGFDEKGVLLTGIFEYQDSKYHLDENGKVIYGWSEYNGRKSYSYSDGTLASGWAEIDGETYFFEGDGTIRTGWVDGTYYRNDNGYCVTGWQTIDGNTYYFDSSTGVIAKGLCEIEGENYQFDDNGILHTGWVTDENGSEIFNSKYGIPANGLENIDGKTYYFIDGIYQTGTVEIDGVSYTFGEDGSITDGWIDNGGFKSYMANGKAVTGEYKIDGVSYMFSQDGLLITGLFTDEDGTAYFKNEYGYNQSGWQTVENDKYYFGNDGKGSNGFQTLNGKTYYFTNGKMAVNTSVGLYKIGSDGVCTKVTVYDSSNAKYRADEIIASTGKSASALYSYVAGHVKYKFVNVPEVYSNPNVADWADMAAYAMNRGTGACYHYAAYLDILFKRAGYTSRIVVGTGHYTSLHCWNQVYINGAWVNYDACNKYSGVTDSYLMSKNYTFGQYVSASY